MALTDNIVIESKVPYVSFSIGAPVTVDAGSYSIAIKDVDFSLSGKTHFVGEGTTSPLFRVENKSPLAIGVGASVTALGDGAQGGQAIYIDNQSSFTCTGKIEAFGTA